jgi:hypothetical protein
LIPVKKELTREQAEAAKEKAARFVEDVLEDDEHADEIRSEGLDEWASAQAGNDSFESKEKPNNGDTQTA